LSRSNVVSVSFPKAAHVPPHVLSGSESREFAHTELQDNIPGSNVIPLPLRAPPSQSSLSFAHRKTLRGTFAWASEVVAADRRLSFAVVETRKRFNRLVRETCPKPTFKPAGEGYERVTNIQARHILTFRAAKLGPEEYKLAAALEAYDDARTDWEAARKQLSVSCGLALLTQQWNEIREDARQAYAILREVGVDPWHH
jgi:hypothetical protein